VGDGGGPRPALPFSGHFPVGLLLVLVPPLLSPEEAHLCGSEDERVHRGAHGISTKKSSGSGGPLRSFFAWSAQPASYNLRSVSVMLLPDTLRSWDDFTPLPCDEL